MGLNLHCCVFGFYQQGMPLKAIKGHPVCSSLSFKLLQAGQWQRGDTFYLCPNALTVWFH